VPITSKLKKAAIQINRTERFCKICNDLEIEDENHFPLTGMPGYPSYLIY
jgi:hypothetical protein